jgi:hypothetical protein
MRSDIMSVFSFEIKILPLHCLQTIQVQMCLLRRIGPGMESLSVYVQLIDYLVDICQRRLRSASTKAWNHMMHGYEPELFANW